MSPEDRIHFYNEETYGSGNLTVFFEPPIREDGRSKKRDFYRIEYRYDSDKNVWLAERIDD